MSWTLTVQAHDAVLEVEAWGDARDPGVLLLAGTSCTRDWWPPRLCERLVSAGLFVVRFDQRDTGASSTWPVGEPGYALGDLVEDAVAILDALDVEVAHLAGFAQGAWVAQLLALGHPERAASLTLIATRPTAHGPADPDLPDVSDALMAAWAQMEEPDWHDTASIVRSYVENERVLAGDVFDEEAARATCEAAVLRSSDIRAASNHVTMDQGPRWREQLTTLTAPTTVLHGSADPLFPVRNGQVLAREIAGARLEILDGVGHELPERVWGTVVEAVTAHTTSR